MTRQEEIRNAVDTIFPIPPSEKGRKYEQALMATGFESGIKWADEHPKSPWISVKDDLPCNHKELLLSTGYHTVTVFSYKKGGACGMDNMIVRNGKWEWEAWKENYLYWMPIPKFPKEYE